MKRLFLAEVVGVVFAAVVFRFGLDPRVAGLIAGLVFVTVGIYGVIVGWRDRRNSPITVAVGALAFIHVVGVALPMLGFRLLKWDEPFERIAVWGMTGPAFHTISTRLYGFWMFVTALAWWFERKKDPSGSSFTAK